MPHRLLPALFAVLLLAVTAPAVRAADILVTSLADNEFLDGQVTLREAVRAAAQDVSVDGSAAGGADDRIGFAAGLTGGTIVLTGGMFQLTGAGILAIDAQALGTDITLDAGGASRHFYLDDTTLELRGLTLTGGVMAGDGGAVYATATGALTLTDCTVAGNQASGSGGGLWLTGPVTLTDTVIRDNTCGSDGGGLRFAGALDVAFTATGSRVSANRAGSRGGGLAFGPLAQVTMTACEVDGNVVEAVDGLVPLGGAVYSEGTVTFTDVTIHDNASLPGNAAIGASICAGAYNNGGHMILDGCQVLDNTVTGPSSGAGLHNGYHGSRNGIMEILNTTVARNTASGGAIFNFEEMILRDSQVLDNTADQSESAGGTGGLNNSGTLTVERTVFRGNLGKKGGLSLSSTASAVISDSEFDANTATFDGGAVSSLGDLQILRTEFHHNTGRDGGAVYANQGTLEIRAGLFHHNDAERGGAVATLLTGADWLLLADSTFHDNTATDEGGALRLLGEAEVVQCTLTANGALTRGGALAHGDGFPVHDGVLLLRQCTVVGNTAELGGGGLLLTSDADLAGSILTANAATAGSADILRTRTGTTFGRVSSLGHNLLGDHDLAAVHATDLDGVTDPQLGPLADNGGPTPTMQPDFGSVVLDGSSTDHTYGLDFDQRGAGHPRVLDGNVNGAAPDIGAVEYAFVCETTVSRTDDLLEPGTLRYALDCAAPGDTVSFDAALAGAVITLGGAQILLDRDVAVDGGALGVTVDADGLSRIFEIASGVNVDVYGLTLTGGNAADGGAVLSFGDLDLYRCVLTGNQASDTGAGAAVYGGGSILAYESEISFNVSDNKGGGLYGNGSASSLLLTRSLVHHNEADTFGGGAHADNGCTFNAVGCEFQDNTASSGGAVRADAVASVSGSTFSGNTATSGGAMFAGQTLSLVQSTFASNAANQGGGLYGYGLFITVQQCTFHGNTASTSGGALFSGNGLIRPSNCILAGNPSPTDDVAFNQNGAVLSDGHNLVGGGPAGIFTQPGDVTGVTDPRLAPLGDWGGPTRTMPLLFGSPALDAGDPAVGGLFTYDQRGEGFPRSLDGDGDGGAACDIGAFESGLLEFGIPVTAVEERTGRDFTNFRGLGFAPFPAVRQIDSDEIVVYGLNGAAAMTFGATADTAAFARGFGVPAAPGVFGVFDGVSGASLALLPGDDDLTPGGVIAAFRNLTGAVVTDMLVQSEVGHLNAGDHAVSVQFAWAASAEPVLDPSLLTFTPIAALAAVTRAAADASPTWRVGEPEATVTGLSLAPGAVFYLRVELDDAGGAGAYDAVSLDNLSVTANPPAASAVETAPGLAGATHLLGDVHPNPFNPRAAFALTVDRDQTVRVELVDVAGRRVAVLHDGPLAGGVEHRFTLDGRGLPSAVYFVRVQGERFADVRRAVLVK